MTSMITCPNHGKLSEKKYSSIRLKDVAEVFQDYKKPALFLSVCFCDWKCCKEAGIPVTVCQNHSVINQVNHELSFSSLLKMVQSSYTDAVLFAGLEPFEQADEVIQCIEYLRANGVQKDIVIYTGYYPEEIDPDTISRLASCDIIMKCGRFVPNSSPRFDEVLGITLVSDNQYGVRLTNRTI